MLTVDFFRSLVSDPYLFGRVAANHALGDCHAMGAPCLENGLPSCSARPLLHTVAALPHPPACLSACRAGAQPTAALATAVVPLGAEPKVEEDLFQMLAGALSVLRPAGCALVGGHSSEGPEQALGARMERASLAGPRRSILWVP